MSLGALPKPTSSELSLGSGRATPVFTELRVLVSQASSAGCQEEFPRANLAKQQNSPLLLSSRASSPSRRQCPERPSERATGHPGREGTRSSLLVKKPN